MYRHKLQRPLAPKPVRNLGYVPDVSAGGYLFGDEPDVSVAQGRGDVLSVQAVVVAKINHQPDTTALLALFFQQRRHCQAVPWRIGQGPRSQDAQTERRFHRYEPGGSDGKASARIVTPFLQLAQNGNGLVGGCGGAVYARVALVKPSSPFHHH